jgi:SAM-dependent methyltransferase
VTNRQPGAHPKVIVCWSEVIVGDNMAEDILLDLAPIVHRHPWWRARAALTLSLLRELGLLPPARILDAGCAWGVTLEALERQGYKTTGLDVSRRALERLDRPGRTLVQADLSKPFIGDLALQDAVLALDVIEHLDDDRATVARLGALVKPGGALIVSVPALPDLFSEFDSIQKHRRRYLPGSLQAAFAGSELELQRIFWWGQWLVPALRRQRARAVSRPGESVSQIYRRYLSVPPWPLPLFAELLLAWERKPAIQGRLRTGTSLFAVARRSALKNSRAS